MKTNILEYLTESVSVNPKKTAYFDEKTRYTYEQLFKNTKAVGSKLIRKLNVVCRPVLVYMEKTPYTLAAFFGTVASRNFYVPLDTNMPEYRIRLIVENLKPVAVITDMVHFDMARSFSNTVFIFEEMIEAEIAEELLAERRKNALDADPVYVLYTSGSTGVPKGVVVSHRSLIDYMEQFCNEIHIEQEDIIANQAPFYFDASLIDIYCTLKMGATMGIIPLEYFSVPVKLLEFLQKY
ncbi:MAG TPA: AMP-binding protein, partial [Lachnospiraceae bacterium]|nr:AMP-binding protein [Lachnospiraceae bacterium]